jgi:hypothetical protein
MAIHSAIPPNGKATATSSRNLRLLVADTASAVEATPKTVQPRGPAMNRHTRDARRSPGDSVEAIATSPVTSATLSPMTLACDCGRQLVEGTTRLESSVDGGPSAWRTVFICPGCNTTYTRSTQRPLVNIDGRVQPGKATVQWSPRPPRE